MAEQSSAVREPAEPTVASPWGAGRPRRPSAALDDERRTDVAIVGAGIVGLTAAVLLQRGGARVVVLEAREVAAASSGNNTAKVSSLQGVAYSKIADHDREAAVLYARANEDGIALIARLVEELEIECAFRRLANYTFADAPEDRPTVEREVESARAAGLAVEFVESAPLPFEVPAARLDDQVEFDPVAYLRALADELDRSEQVVFEGSRAIEVDGGDVRTADGRVRADRVLLATHLPTVDRVGIFARAEPQASPATSARLAGPAPEGMFIDARGKRSLRALRLGDEQLLVVAGAGHRLGSGDAEASFAELEDYARSRFDARGFAHRWDAHDYVTEDRLPFVGAVHPRSDRVLTATGMNKWGLALGSACAEMLAETLSSGEQAWPAQFDSRRLPVPRAWPTLAEHGAKTAVHLVGDRLKRGSADGLAPGEGAIVGAGIEQRAGYRDDAGRLHQLSARCTHLGCIVAFNRATRTWDCPCHGSRFDLDGSVLEGPAVKPLGQI